ncbi:MAG: TonB family protein [Bacteroidetes bacterium]|nr:TonB family protein [Bacteroidota bacterium]
MKTTDIYSHEWCELVFEGRNHAYGAYELREHIAKRQITAIFIAASLLIMVAASPMILNRERNGDNHIINSGTIEIIRPPIDKPKDNVDPIIEPAKGKPVLVNTVAFPPTHIVPDVEAPDVEIAPQDKLINDPRNIAATTVDGGVTGPVTGNWDGTTTGGVKTVDTTTYMDVPQMPVFLSGEDDLFNYLRSSIKYPALARELNITGIVYASFIVNREGNVQDIKILRAIGGGCEDEALRVLSRMPRWNPGKQNGNAVNVRLNIPINFVLN